MYPMEKISIVGKSTFGVHSAGFEKNYTREIEYCAIVAFVQS